MKKTVDTILLILIAALPLLSCTSNFGLRHFSGPVLPDAEQAGANIKVGDDRSVTYKKGRLEVNLRPLTDEILNRQLESYNPEDGGFYQNPYESNINPFTYGDWTPPEQSWATTRFTVFNLSVKNYEFPKVLLKPENVTLVADNGRKYPALSFPAMNEYYLTYSWANAGNLYLNYEERKDILTRMMFTPEAYVFSGQEASGYIVFPPLHHDVGSFDVVIEDVVVRFDFRDEAVESTNIRFRFQRDLYMAKSPRPVEPLRD